MLVGPSVGACVSLRVSLRVPLCGRVWAPTSARACARGCARRGRGRRRRKGAGSAAGGSQPPPPPSLWVRSSLRLAFYRRRPAQPPLLSPGPRPPPGWRQPRRAARGKKAALRRLRAPPRGHAAPLLARPERSPSPRRPPRSLSARRGLRSAPGAGTGPVQAAQESSAAPPDCPAARPWGRGWRAQRPAAGWDWDTCCRPWCSPPWLSWGPAAPAPRRKVRRWMDAWMDRWRGVGASSVRVRNEYLCRDYLFYCVCTCKQCDPPHSRPAARFGVPGPTGRVGSVGAERGRDRRLPVLRPQMGRGERRGSLDRRSPAGRPVGRESGAGARRRAGKVRGKGRCGRVSLRSGKAVPRSSATDGQSLTPQGPPPPPFSCLKHDTPEGSHRLSVYVLGFCFLSCVEDSVVRLDLPSL